MWALCFSMLFFIELDSLTSMGLVANIDKY